jgi:hypothetical protein
MFLLLIWTLAMPEKKLRRKGDEASWRVSYRDGIEELKDIGSLEHKTLEVWNI